MRVFRNVEPGAVRERIRGGLSQPSVYGLGCQGVLLCWGAMKTRHRVIVEAHLILRRPSSDGSSHEILFGRRRNTGYADGVFHLPSGHLEADESITDALIRESFEEVGIKPDPEQVRFSHVMHKSCNGGRMSYFFTVDSYEGEPVNNEPHKCSELAWFRADALPDNLLDYCQRALSYIAKDSHFSTYTCNVCC